MTQSETSQMISTTQQTPVAAVNITYDKLFELLRVERNDPNLQRLSSTFFADVRVYLQVKLDSIAKSKNSSDIFAAEHVETAQQQVRNAMRILADITDRRERKILNLALNKARAASSAVDTGNLLAEEKAMFAQIVALLAAQRSTLQQLLTTPSPSSASLATGAASAVASIASASAITETAVPTPVGEPAAEKPYLVIEEITEFFGPDMRHYGPFSKGDNASFSDQIARILLKKNLVKQL